MKYKLTFLIEKELSLPLQYNHIVQAAVLNWLSPNGENVGEDSYGTFLHDVGFKREKRQYKLYTFSNLFGTYKIQQVGKGKRILFYEKVEFYLSSYVDDMNDMIVQNFMENRPIQLGGQWLQLAQCNIIEESYEACIVKTVSPITVHTTVFTADGKKKTYFYSPTEKDFGEEIRNNLKRKYEAIHGKALEDDTFSIELCQRKPWREAKMYYKDFSIRGWNGYFKLSGSEEMIKMALLSGIGARNSIGLGCVVQEQ